jgi:hypothetical protein
MPKNDAKKVTYKLIKISLKIDSKWTTKKSFIIARHGGVINYRKSSFLDIGTPDPPFYKFFEICSLFAKTVQISTPKIDPINGPIENSIPHKNACTFAPMGV